jgi:hypothetical protein
VQVDAAVGGCRRAAQSGEYCGGADTGNGYAPRSGDAHDVVPSWVPAPERFGLCF